MAAAGSALPGIAPSNAYPCADGFVLIAGNGDSIFKRLMQAIGRPDLASAPDLGSNDGRARRVAELDEAISGWTKTRAISAVLAAMQAAKVPAGRVYTAKDIDGDPHYRERGMILKQRTRDGYEVDVPGIVPTLSGTPGSIRSPAPGLGQDTDAVLGEFGYSAEEIAELRKANVI